MLGGDVCSRNFKRSRDALIHIAQAPRQWRRMAAMHLSESKFHNWISIPDGVLSVTGIPSRYISKFLSARKSERGGGVEERARETLEPLGTETSRDGENGRRSKRGVVKNFCGIQYTGQPRSAAPVMGTVTRHSETPSFFFVPVCSFSRKGDERLWFLFIFLFTLRLDDEIESLECLSWQKIDLDPSSSFSSLFKGS